MEKFYEEAYMSSVTQMEIRKDVQLMSKDILWVLTVDNTGAAQSYLSAADQAAQKVERQREKSTGTCGGGNGSGRCGGRTDSYG